MRDLDERPYSADESRVARWLSDKIGIGGGDDPIGFVIVSHEGLAAERNHLKDVLRRFRSYASKELFGDDDGGKSNPIWTEVSEAIK